MQLVLGVDGGGTKTLAWLAPLEAADGDDPIGIGASGPGNPRAVGFDQALASIDQAVHRAFVSAGIMRTTVERACIALAGADRETERSKIEAWAQERRLCTAIHVTNDAEPILAAASPNGFGVALICGTGSFAFGRNKNTETVRCGGWGYLFGDEGSGYDIALQALRAAARAADGRGKPTVLLRDLLQRLGQTAPSGLVEAIYRSDMPRQQIADLSGIVFDAGSRGDAVAHEILQAATVQLCELVSTIVGKLRFSAGEYPLALAGGVLLHAPQLCDAIVQRLADRNAAPGAVTLVPEPVRGAVAIARKSWSA